MKETTFINQNKKKWATFEKMSKTQQNDPDEMSRLFVELTDDLSFARTYYPKRSVRVYLNSLAQRVFHDLYKKKRTPLKKFFTFWTEDLPMEMFRARMVLLYAFVIFALGFLIGMVSTIDNEDFLGSVIGYDYVSMAEHNIEKGQPMSVYGRDTEAMSFVGIAANNLKVMFITFVLGIFFSFGSVIYLFFNSIMVGAFQWFYVVRNLTLASFLTIWIHGAFEIPAIILSAAAGITMGNGILFPGTLTRGQSLVISAKRGIKMMIGTIPFIILAAFIEGYATRHTVITIEGDPIPNEWPDSLKWLFILTCFAIIIFYFVIYPMMVAKKAKFDGKVYEAPKYVKRHEINLYRIKDVGELFSDTFSSYAKSFVLFGKLFLISVPLIGLYVYLLFQNIPFYNYRVFDGMFGDWIFGRAEKIWDNLEVIYLWNDYFVPELFFMMVFIFALNAFHIMYALRVKVIQDINPSFKSYFRLMFKSFIPLYIAFCILGIITTQVNFGLMLLIGSISPFLIMWALPTALTRDKFGKGLTYGLTKSWKSFGQGIGLFFALAGTLAFIFTFIGVPFDQIKDMPINWFVAPLADNPQYVFTMIDAGINLIISHLIFPIFMIAFSFLYFSIIEKEEATGMFERLKEFGKKSKVYEAFDEGTY
ncbi:MAG: stage II sporulation protein M [Flavobacteriales bacterium]|nr:stage II sporulation protein M [Flavobacteriales bacterium]